MLKFVFFTWLFLLISTSPTWGSCAFLLRPSILIPFSLQHVRSCQPFHFFFFSYTFHSLEFTWISQHFDKYRVNTVVSTFTCFYVVICSAFQKHYTVTAVWRSWSSELLEAFDLAKALCESFPTSSVLWRSVFAVLVPKASLFTDSMQLVFCFFVCSLLKLKSIETASLTQ